MESYKVYESSYDVRGIAAGLLFFRPQQCCGVSMVLRNLHSLDPWNLPSRKAQPASLPRVKIMRCVPPVRLLSVEDMALASMYIANLHA